MREIEKIVEDYMDCSQCEKCAAHKPLNANVPWEGSYCNLLTYYQERVFEKIKQIVCEDGKNE